MGLANQTVVPGRTTLLEAVNVCLAVIGEAPVNTLETQQVGEAAQAERTLLEYCKEGQTRGWSWNRERAVSFYRDAVSGEVLIPPSVVKWAPSRLDWNNRFQARGSRVYDREERSYSIPATIASIEADIVSLLPWDDCPEVFNRWATIRAARVFSNRAVGNTTTYQLTQSDEDAAWADLLRVDTEQAQPNAITGEEAWATFRPAMGLGRRNGGSAGWGAYGGGGLGGTSSGVTLPQALGPDASPTFAGLTLSAFSTFSGQLCVLGTNGAINPLPLGSGLSIVGGALVSSGSYGGSGTVTSVGLSLPALFLVTGSPVTSDGTLTATLATQSANLVWAGPTTGVAAAPAFRTLVAADLPATTVTTGSYGSASSVSTFTVDAAGRLTVAGSTAIAIASTAVSGLATVATSGSATDLATGTLPAARLPATAVSAGSYTYGSFTVDAAGRLTAASNGTVPIASVLTGFTSGAGTVAATDSILQAIQKLDGNNAARATAGAIGSSGLTMSTARLLGRTTATTGAVEEISIGANLTLTAGVLAATGGPGGSTTQIQYNNAGAFAGATNVKITSNNLQLTTPGSAPAAADASSVVVYPASLADRFMVAMRGPTGAATLLQPSIFSNNIMLFAPQSGTVGTGSSAFQTAWTSNGTVTHPTPAATDVASSGRRTAYTNVVTTTNQQLGPRFNTDSERCFFRGNVASTGGFFYFSRFRITCPAATVRLFSGLQGVSASNSVCTTDTPTGPYCGLAHITTDPSTGSGALSFVTHDGTTRNALAINLTADLVTNSPLLEFSMYCAPNGGTIFFRLDDVSNGVTYTNSTTANLPGATVIMSPQCQASNGTANVTVSTVFMNVYKIYVESVY